MPTMIDMRVCELLAARLCHDMAGPVAAIANGAELLGDDDPDFAREAATLIGDSARTAAKRLQFFRYIFGFSRGVHAGPPPHALASEYFAGSAIECDYPGTVRQLEPEWQRLACSLLFVGAEGLPRGGLLALDTIAGGLALTGTGEGDGPPAESRAALTQIAPVAELTARSVCAYFAGLLAGGLGRRLVLTAEPGRFGVKCEADAEAPASIRR
jgi:histidine phosphotransferase ChpT